MYLVFIYKQKDVYTLNSHLQPPISFLWEHFEAITVINYEIKLSHEKRNDSGSRNYILTL